MVLLRINDSEFVVWLGVVNMVMVNLVMLISFLLVSVFLLCCKNCGFVVCIGVLVSVISLLMLLVWLL